MDYYETLGIGRDASQSEIKKAYRELSKKWHPDKHAGDKKAEEKYKQINRAYECLSDSAKKQAYDRFGSEDPRQFGGGNPFGAGFSGFESGVRGFGDIFDTFFGGSGSDARRTDMQGRDVQAKVRIKLEEAFNGVAKKIRMRKLIMCAPCSGSGEKKGSGKVSCAKCNGTGQVIRTAQSFFGVVRQSAICDSCKGSGRVPESPCGACAGEGRVNGAEEVMVDIPAGIADGQTLRISGKGEAGRQGAPYGDLYVFVSVEPDNRFTRDGDDLRTRVNVSVADAVLGAETTLETFIGMVTIKIPPGTQPGQVLKLKGKGMPVLNTSRHGNLYVDVNVEVPQRLKRKEKKLWEAIRAGG